MRKWIVLFCIFCAGIAFSRESVKFGVKLSSGLYGFDWHDYLDRYDGLNETHSGWGSSYEPGLALNVPITSKRFSFSSELNVNFRDFRASEETLSEILLDIPLLFQLKPSSVKPFYLAIGVLFEIPLRSRLEYENDKQETINIDVKKEFDTSSLDFGIIPLSIGFMMNAGIKLDHKWIIGLSDDGAYYGRWDFGITYYFIK
ncbi:MAG: hypothetical protein LBR60_02075 [Fibrobacter sp.]|jgi:hypothetical protein|nr:hypothetical protein [Fibrobacter sp.]